MRQRNAQIGFSLIEVMLVMVIFLIVTGSVFALLNATQVRYRTEQQILDILQSARAGIDLLSRDVNRAGYPPLNSYDPSAPGFAGGVPASRQATPFVGMVGGAVNPACVVDTAIPPVLSTCTVPNNFELIIETDLDPDNAVTPEQVEWVYYRLDRPGNALASPPAGGGRMRTLYRAVSPKIPGVDPRSGVVVPFVENVLNDPARLVANPNQALFRFVCNGGTPTCTPNNIAEVSVVMQVQANLRDLRTRQAHAVTLQSTARRLNPPQ